MNGDLIAATVLATPAALFAAIAFTGHARARRADDALATALATTTPTSGPGGPGEPHPAPEAEGSEPGAAVIAFPQHRARTAPTIPNTVEENAA
ncbi:hypothetical protein OG746_08325 [Streptomyces sp. NBC_01016]|uniref:hypothetical protein n=1 Tax=Streptomyces sp. NBC_01016 TaxID=2903720 RepID=UPI00224D5CC1|nr:hypothetical protein [Streptomyces sp. NBC_01016]MCX4828729.1 hypothetical protein [Streptomyces sp. NBC_01016]